MTPAAQRYHEMTDEELIDFVAARLPKMLHRIQHKPRCLLCQDIIVDELARSMGQSAPSAMQGDFAAFNQQGGHLR
jgi:hypothetical protein